jgi:lysophospholipase L1-like esterase
VFHGQNPTGVVRGVEFWAGSPQKKIPLVPFFLDGIGGHPDLMQADGLHPAVGAQGKLLENVWPTLKPLL